MDAVTLKDIAPYAVALIAFLLGWVFRNLEKKTVENEGKLSTHGTKISNIEIKAKEQKESNDEAHKLLRDSMTTMANELTQFMHESRKYMGLTAIHQVEIDNIKEGNKIRDREISKIKDKAG